MTDLLEQIQSLQFHDKPAAEALLLGFVRETFPQLDVERLELRPLAVSLNSFNGYLYPRGGEKLFFKTHIEQDGVVGEYYRAESLAAVGYPILRPLLQSHTAGKQLLIYPFIDAPSVFDVAWEIEQGDLSQMDSLTAAQHDLDDALFRLYEKTLTWLDAERAADAAVHQLFYHRLAGERLERFYGGDARAVVVDSSLPEFRIVINKKWIINSQRHNSSLQIIINQSKHLLSPQLASGGITGHGDAHNGNVFYHKQAQGITYLTYFDPAFAGVHDPLLDLTKPLFHNIFAMWMYHSAEKNAATNLHAEVRDDTIYIEHDYAIHPVRMMFLRSKVERALIPTLKLLKERGWLQPYWRERLKAALFCCPFLTRNLLDTEKFPPKITLLGLAQAVEMGSESEGRRSLIDTVLDEAEVALQA
jgi:hypothetical protein